MNAGRLTSVPSVVAVKSGGRNETMIDLQRVSDDEFAGFIQAILVQHAAERAAADQISIGAAERQARAQHDRLLPQQARSPGHVFAWIKPSGTSGPVGMAWWHEDDRSGEAFLYWISIDPAHRRRGLASAAIAAIEGECRARRCTRLRLNVFARNAGAIALYRKLGFDVASMHMSKALHAHQT